MSIFWNETVQKLDPYVPGEQPQDKSYIKLNTNENPYPPSPLVMEAMKNAINDNLKLYPDPNCSSLVKSIAEFYNVDEDEVFVGNGSDEVLSLTFQTFFSPNKKILYPEISYSFYPVYAQLFNLNPELVSLDEEFNINTDEMMKENGGIILPNPNAPTSKCLSVDILKKIVEANKDSVVVIDEAYIDFGGESMVPYIKEYNNLLIIQTLSKSRSLAGLRCGIAIGHKDLIQGLNNVKNSFNSYTLDRIALAGATAAFEDVDYFNKTREMIINTREKVSLELKELGFKVLDSKANFIFASHNKVHANDIYKSLKEKGVLVRHWNKPEKISNYLRITIGTDEEMKILIEKIKEII